MLRHVLKVDTEDGILQILGLLYSNLNVFWLVLLVNLKYITSLVVDTLLRLNLKPSLVGLSALLSVGLHFELLVDDGGKAESSAHLPYLGCGSGMTLTAN